ncbi:MAG: condensation domain-containing protein, partial [Acidobacteriota bacterium]|nr:condensation domain-containing protein [Acidobacteriota bacterium]
LRWMRAVSRYRITASGGPNFAYDLCVRHATPEFVETLDLTCVRAFSTGAEHIRLETLNRFAETFAPCGFRRETFLAAYGLTEATLVVSIGFDFASLSISTSALENNRVVEAEPGGENSKSVVSCGRVLPEQKVAIINPATLAECAPDAVGEIWVSGPSISQGYWQRPEESRHTFGAFIEGTGEGPFLRTGDLGFLRGTHLFVTGRLKDLIIIRGRNHYPQDIEATVEKCHPAIRQGGGAAFSVEAGGEERLVVVHEVTEADPAKAHAVIGAVRQAVAREHGILVYGVLLIREGTIPRTASNKIQRGACRTNFLAGTIDYIAAWQADLASGGDVAGAPEAATPEGDAEVEAWLVRLLAAKFGVNPAEVGRDVPITLFGLDSLRATELAHAVESGLGVSISMSSLLHGPTVTELAAQIAERRAEGPAAAPSSIPSADGDECECALSRNQQALWFIQQMAPESAAYNVASAVRIHSGLNVETLRRAYQLLVDRHAALRTTFVSRSDRPVQRVHERMEVFFEELDASSWSEEFLTARLSELATRPFNLEEGPLLRLYLCEGAPGGSVLLTVIHHVITDLWSLAVMTDELRAIYTALNAGLQPDLAPPALTYFDLTRWLHEMLEGAEGEGVFDYWSRRLAGEVPALNLPTDRPRPPAQTFRGASYPFRLDAELTAGLKSLGRERGVTLYMILLAALQVLLYRYTGQEDFAVGSPVSARTRREMGLLVGHVVNTLVMRADLSGNPAFAQFLSQVRETVLGAFEHQNYPFSLLVERLQPERDPSRSPLFQVMFVMQEVPVLNEEGLAQFALRRDGARMQLGEMSLSAFALEQRSAQFDLTLAAAETPEGVSASFEYNSDLFDAATVARFAEHLRTLLRSVVNDPEQRVALLPLLPEDERRRLLVEWNRTDAPFDEAACLHQLFEAQAARTPDAVAVVHQRERLTYAELDARAGRLARALEAMGVGPE